MEKWENNITPMTRFWNFFKRILNIQVQKNQGWLLMSSSVSGLIYTYTHPVIVKATISNLPERYISLEALWFCVSAMIIGAIWKGCVREKAIKYFTYIATIESLAAFSLGCYMAFVNWNVWVFAISSALYLSIVSQFIGKCVMAFKASLWIEKEREDFDNTSSIISNTIAMIGFAIATIAMPKLEVAVFLWGCGCIFDDIGWIIVYRKTRKHIIDNVT